MTVSGFCAQGHRAARKPGRLREATAFHRSCRGRVFSRPGEPPEECDCACHRPPQRPDLAETLKVARAQRLAEAGVDPIPPARGTAEKCRHGHPRTPENTGSRGECLACKRQKRAST